MSLKVLKRAPGISVLAQQKGNSFAPGEILRADGTPLLTQDDDDDELDGEDDELVQKNSRTTALH